MKRYLGCKCKKFLPFSTDMVRCPVCQRLYRVVTEREVTQRRLIAAAPALLEACKAVLPFVAGLHVVRQLVAALALAEPLPRTNDEEEEG